MLIARPDMRSRKSLLSSAYFTAWVAAGFLSASVVALPSSITAVSSLAQAERALVAADVAEDVPALSKLLADDYLFVSAGGEQDKAQLLESFRSGAVVYDELRILESRTRILDRVAVVTGRSMHSYTNRGRKLTGPQRFTRVWVLRSEQWQLVSYQLTPESSQ